MNSDNPVAVLTPAMILPNSAVTGPDLRKLAIDVPEANSAWIESAHEAAATHDAAHRRAGAYGKQE